MWVDAKLKKTSNWLRYINCARCMFFLTSNVGIGFLKIRIQLPQSRTYMAFKFSGEFSTTFLNLCLPDRKFLVILAENGFFFFEL